MKSSSASAKSDGAEHRENADDENPRVRTNRTGLEPGSDPADSARERRAPVDEEVVNHARVDEPPEEIARDSVCGLDDHSIVDFVDIVFVGDDTLDSMFRRSC